MSACFYVNFSSSYLPTCRFQNISFCSFNGHKDGLFLTKGHSTAGNMLGFKSPVSKSSRYHSHQYSVTLPVNLDYSTEINDVDI